MIAELHQELSTILRKGGRELGGVAGLDTIANKAWLMITIALEKTAGKRVSLAEAKLAPYITDEAALMARYWASQLARGIPLQYATGRADFLDHSYDVGPGVLIPRPETEVLVQTAIERLASPRRGFEWGIGSGIIAIELLAHFPDLSMHAIDISSEARKFAQANAERILGPGPIGAGRLQIDRDWAATDRELDFVISNPPYLAPGNSAEAEEQVVQHEPHSALFAPGSDLLIHYRELVSESATRLRAGGALFLEIPHERARAVTDLLSSSDFDGVEVVADLTGRPRVIAARRKA